MGPSREGEEIEAPQAIIVWWGMEMGFHLPIRQEVWGVDTKKSVLCIEMRILVHSPAHLSISFQTSSTPAQSDIPG